MTVSVAWYCSCGCCFEMELDDGLVLEKVRAAWDKLHSAPGHEPRDRAANVVEQSLDELQLLAAAASAAKLPEPSHG